MIATDAELERIVQQYRNTVWKIALSMTRNTYDAEDVFQDVFVRLVDSIEKIENEEHLKAWLIRVTVNRCKSWSKTSWKMKVDFIEKMRERQGDLHEPRVEDDYTPPMDASFDEEMARTFRGEQVMRVLQGLSLEYRVVVYLFYCEDLSVKEIAQMLRLRENAVRTRLSRARDKVREGVRISA